MLRELHVSNFRSLGEDCRVSFQPLTALVGPNGCGKSNVVDVLGFVSDAMRIGLSGAITTRHGIQAVRRWSAGHPYNVSIALELATSAGAAKYAFELRGDSAEEYSVKSEDAWALGGGEQASFRVEHGNWVSGPHGLQPQLDPQSLALPLVGGDHRFSALFQSLSAMAVYTIFPDTLRAPQKYNPQKPMDRHGSNWASVLKDQASPSWKPELIQALRKLTGDIEDMRIVPAASYLVVQFRHSSASKAKKWFDAAQQSDGTLRVAGIVSALLQEPPVPVVAVEEPELTVHPGAIPLLFDYLSQASRQSQVVLTTHSPELLDLLEVESIRVVARQNGATTVSPLQNGQREAVRSGLMSLGEMLRIGELSQATLFESSVAEP